MCLTIGPYLPYLQLQAHVSHNLNLQIRMNSCKDNINNLQSTGGDRLKPKNHHTATRGKQCLCKGKETTVSCRNLNCALAGNHLRMRENNLAELNQFIENETSDV